MGLILVASQDKAEIETIKAALSVHGWWVTVADDRESAIQAAADQAPKLVLVDQDLPGAIELVRAFGSGNGGPGVLACVSEGFDGSLELKEAGVDEMITKPLSPPGLLEVVHRCLAAPRPVEAERPVSAKQLLTTEEIFGDVLRELEDDPAPAAEAPPPAAIAPAPPAPAAETINAAPAVELPPLSPPSPAPAAALAGLDSPFDPAPADAPVVSLAGLFDEEPETLLPEPKPVPEWNGEERRGPERPWESGAERSAPPDVDQLFADSENVEAAAAPTVLEPPSALQREREEAAPPVVAVTPPDEMPSDEAPPEETPDDEPELAMPASEAPSRRWPRFALISGALAASLLVAAGVIFLKNPGAEVAAPPVEPAEPVESTAVETGPPPAESTPTAAEPEPPSSPVVETAAVPEPIDDLDLEAIVEQELERREEDLRQVFLEEERRLLRELNKLEESEPEGEEGAEEADGGSSGDGR